MLIKQEERISITKERINHSLCKADNIAHNIDIFPVYTCTLACKHEASLQRAFELANNTVK